MNPHDTTAIIRSDPAHQQCLGTPDCDCPLFHSRRLLKKDTVISSKDGPPGISRAKLRSRVKKFKSMQSRPERERVLEDKENTRPGLSAYAQGKPSLSSPENTGPSPFTLVPLRASTPIPGRSLVPQLNVPFGRGDEFEDLETEVALNGGGYSPLLDESFGNENLHTEIGTPENGFKPLPIFQSLTYEDIEKNRMEDPLRKLADNLELSQPITEVVIYDSDDELPLLSVPTSEESLTSKFTSPDSCSFKKLKHMTVGNLNEGTKLKIKPQLKQDKVITILAVPPESSLASPINTIRKTSEIRSEALQQTTVPNPSQRSKIQSISTGTSHPPLPKSRHQVLRQFYRNESGKFTCPFCKYKCDEYQNLRQHCNIHTGFKYKCPKCNQAFRHLDCCRDKTGSLRTHQRVCKASGATLKSNNNKPAKSFTSTTASYNSCSDQFMCFFCEKSFRLRIQLKFHLMFDHEERPSQMKVKKLKIPKLGC